MKTKKRILIILMIISTFLSVFTYTNSVQATTSSSISEPNFTIYSEGAVLMESSTGQVLYGKNQNEKLYPASTTKILTAILAIENCKLTDKITASYDAVMCIPSGYSNAAIQVGETLTAQELLDMFLIHSANEIGNIFAEHISGSIDNFAKLMNQKATEIGCKNTHFTNPSGIHDTEHYSTAYDMALIARYCMKNETFRNIVSKVTCTVEATDKYEKRFFRNTNDLIDPKSQYYYEYAIGIKTGFTSQAKNCLISASLKDGLELITVALGAEATSDGKSGRYVDTLNLFEYGYSNYKVQKIATKNSVIDEIIIGNATKDTENLSLLVKNDITGIIPANMNINDLNPSIQLNEIISAPIKQGDVLGKITYNINGIEYSSDLIANNNVEELNEKLMLSQIALALLVLFVFAKLLIPKKKSKKRKSKKKHSNYQKSGTKRYSDSTYKF